MILVFGADGRMGRSILEVAQKENFGRVEAFTKDQVPSVVIDFSSPEGTMEVLKWCMEKKIPLVSGTTGLSPEQRQSLLDAGKKIPVFWSANMSVGIRALVRALEELPFGDEVLKVAIEETHHTHKKDSPSGTAKTLFEVLKKKFPRAKHIEPMSHRKGEVLGDHQVTLQLEGEELIFEHRAKSRDIFARGALKVAHWILKQKPGYYSMNEFMK